MDNRPIQVGDYVYIVGNSNDLLCEHVTRWLGLPRKVMSIVESAHLVCTECEERIWPNVKVARLGNIAMRVTWLKRIDPLAEPETVERDDEVTV